MSRALRMLLTALSLLCCLSARASADGMVLVPTLAMRSLTEEYQGAVVSVNPDHTADVDLFISLATTSRTPQEVHFLLPLQTVPTRFHAREQTQQQFSEQKLKTLDKTLDDGAHEARLIRNGPGGTFLLSSLLLGPWAVGGVLGMGRKVVLAGTMEGARPVSPTLSTVTEHTQADIYPALNPDQVAALAGLSDLPPSVQKTLRGYAGRPFALVRLRLTPHRSAVDRARGQITDDSAPGVHFTFTQQLLPDRGGSVYRYAFPLGTGQAWANPIATTLIYVTAPDSLNLHVSFPDRPFQGKMSTRTFASLRTVARAEVAQGRQVYAAPYDPASGRGNPSRDVQVELRTTGRCELLLHREANQLKSTTATVLFPLFALLAWLAASRIFLPWGWRRGVLHRAAVLFLCWLAAHAAQWMLALGFTFLWVVLYSTRLDVVFWPLFIIIAAGTLFLGVRGALRTPAGDLESVRLPSGGVFFFRAPEDYPKPAGGFQDQFLWRSAVAGAVAYLLYLGLGAGVLKLLH